MKRAFTLIELLVVVAIIALLVAILLPSLRRATAMAETVRCAAQLRQFSNALMAYATDHQTVVPGSNGWCKINVINRNDSWKTQAAVYEGSLYPYVNQQDDLYLCPTFLKVLNLDPANANATPAFCYSMNIYFRYEGWAGKPPLRRLGQMRHPASLMWMTEENPFLNGSAYVSRLNDPSIAVSWGPAYVAPLDSLGSYHLGDDPYTGSANVLFVDGHVNLHKPDEGYEIGTPIEYRP